MPEDTDCNLFLYVYDTCFLYQHKDKKKKKKKSKKIKKKKKKKEQLTKKERHILSACFFMARSYECCNYVISTLHNIEYIITKSWCKNVELHVQTMHARAM